MIDPGDGTEATPHLSRRLTLGFLLSGLLIAVGAPVHVAFARGLEVYLLHPAVLVLQAAPYLLAGALWLPFRAPDAVSIGRWTAGALSAATAALYVPMLVDSASIGGDMVALLFAGISAATTLAVFLAALVGYGVLYIRRHGRTAKHH